MEQELRLFELTVEGNLIALKIVVEKHPNIHLSDCWTGVINNTNIVSIDSAVYYIYHEKIYSQKGYTCIDLKFFSNSPMYISLLHQAATSGLTRV